MTFRPRSVSVTGYLVPGSGRGDDEIQARCCMLRSKHVAAAVLCLAFSGSPLSASARLKGFSAPIVRGGNLIVVGPNSDQLVCLTRGGDVSWRTRPSFPPIRFVSTASQGDLLLVAGDTGLSVDVQTGDTTSQHPLKYKAPGRILQLMADWRACVMDLATSGPIRCADLRTGHVFWEWEPPDRSSVVSVDCHAGHLLIGISPGVSSAQLVSEKALFEGTLCLRVSNGSRVWEEISIQRDGDYLANLVSIASCENRLLCASTYAVRVMDAETARQHSRWETPQDGILGAAFWPPDRIVVCMGDRRLQASGNPRTRIAILSLSPLAVIEQFDIVVKPDAVAGVVADKLILSDRGPTWGVDLRLKAVAWGPIRMSEITIDGDHLYFANTESNPMNGRLDCVVGVCDPATGAVRILHRESIHDLPTTSGTSKRER